MAKDYQLSVKVTQGLIDQIDAEIAKESSIYSNRSDFVKAAIRMALDKLRSETEIES